MTLRGRLLAAQGPLVVALLLAALAGSAVVLALAKSAGNILRENYRSVLAAQRMDKALERLDLAALFRIACKPELLGDEAARSRRVWVRSRPRTHTCRQRPFVHTDLDHERTPSLDDDGKALRSQLVGWIV